MIENDFNMALNSSDSVESICVAFFDYIYALYFHVNSRSGIKTYSKKVVQEAYYNISFCDSDCGK